MMIRCIVLCLLVLLPSFIASFDAMEEMERQQEYFRRGYRWPPSLDEFSPPNEGWRDLALRRINQLSRIENISVDQTWNQYLNQIYAFIKAPSFTELGWEVRNCPQDVLEVLLSNMNENLEKVDYNIDRLRFEHDNRAIYGPSSPRFIDLYEDTTEYTLKGLKPVLEDWSGVPLELSVAYGLRVYRNDSTLSMHIDNTETHIISAILHLGHDDDSEPWPLVIEGFDGHTYEVELEVGDILLYESSKCVHGRPKPFKGDWYTSIFVHYYPSNWDSALLESAEVKSRVPPGWNFKNKTISDVDTLEITEYGTMFEPNCEHQWCGLKNSVKLSSGQVVATGLDEL